MAGRAGHQVGRFRESAESPAPAQDARCDNAGCPVGVTLFYGEDGTEARATWWVEGRPKSDEQELWTLPACGSDLTPVALAPPGQRPAKRRRKPKQ
jgi:hypothetical protein